MRDITIEVTGGMRLRFYDKDRITITFATSTGIFSVTGPPDLAFEAAAKAFRK